MRQIAIIPVAISSCLIRVQRQNPWNDDVENPGHRELCGMLRGKGHRRQAKAELSQSAPCTFPIRGR